MKKINNFIIVGWVFVGFSIIFNIMHEYNIYLNTPDNIHGIDTFFRKVFIGTVVNVITGPTAWAGGILLLIGYKKKK